MQVQASTYVVHEESLTESNCRCHNLSLPPRLFALLIFPNPVQVSLPADPEFGGGRAGHC